jgi:RNA polymerase sigma-70 factor (ECF subfamily)
MDVSSQSASIEPSLDDGAICARIRAQDSRAEAELVKRYRAVLVRILQGRLRDKSLAEDFAQDTLATVLQILRSKDLDDPTNLAGFIYATANNLLRNDYRKDSRRKTDTDSDIGDMTADERLSVESRTIRESSAQAVRSLLAELSVERDRELLTRAYLYEQDKVDICRELALTPQHYERVMHRARERFRQVVEARLGRGAIELALPLCPWLLPLLLSLNSHGETFGTQATVPGSSTEMSSSS